MFGDTLRPHVEELNEATRSVLRGIDIWKDAAWTEDYELSSQGSLGGKVYGYLFSTRGSLENETTKRIYDAVDGIGTAVHRELDPDRSPD